MISNVRSTIKVRNLKDFLKVLESKEKNTLKVRGSLPSIHCTDLWKTCKVMAWMLVNTQLHLKAYQIHTINPQKIVRLSFPSLVFWVRLSLEVHIFKTEEIMQNYYTSNESPLRYDIKLKNCPVYLTLHRIRTQMKLGSTMFWERLIFEDLRYLVHSIKPSLGK